LCSSGIKIILSKKTERDEGMIMRGHTIYILVQILLRRKNRGERQGRGVRGGDEKCAQNFDWKALAGIRRAQQHYRTYCYGSQTS
jgi:hypothetical protein